MRMLYLGDMTFDVPLEDQRGDGWTPDCQGKMDYDPVVVRLSSRAYPNGGYGCSVYLGEHLLVETGHLKAADQTHAMNAVEAWSRGKVAVIASVMRAVFPVPGSPEDNMSAIDAAAQLITAAIADHDEGLAAVIDSKLLATKIRALVVATTPPDDPALVLHRMGDPAPAIIGAGETGDPDVQTLKADFDQIRNDLYWKVWAGDDGRVSWTGYDDANWWDNVSKTDAARNRVGKTTGRVYRLDHATGVVEILRPKAEG